VVRFFECGDESVGCLTGNILTLSVS